MTQSLGYSRYEPLFDNQLWLQSLAAASNLPADMEDDGPTISLPEDSSVEDFVRDTLLAGTSLSCDIHQSPDDSYTVYITDAKKMFGFTFTAWPRRPGAWGTARFAYAGTSGLQNLIMERLLAAKVDVPPAPFGHYYIQVHEIFTTKDEAGNTRLQQTNHSLCTRDRLLGLRKELYPYLGVDKLVNTFLGSQENLFLLYGDPGVGKTCMMKTILRETAFLTKSNYHAIYIKDTAALRLPELWVQLGNMSKNTSISPAQGGDEAPTAFNIGNDTSACVYLILDDLDNELGQRAKGADNFIVSQLLSFSDGLFENHLKVIITTNQEIKDIDSAIIRPGRCFDVLNLRQLTKKEALDVWVNTLQCSEELFEQSFANAESVSQAALMSEHTRATAMSHTRDYLLDPSISIRKALIEGSGKA